MILTSFKTFRLCRTDLYHPRLVAQTGTPRLDFAVVVRPAGPMITTRAMLRAIPVYAGAWCSSAEKLRFKH